MYKLFHEFLADKTGGEVFTLFSGWHFLYIALVAITIGLVLFLSRKKNYHQKARIAKVFVHIAFILYMADFFLMPLAYGVVDIDKLPFHACTTMCLICFISYYNKFLAKYRMSFVMLGLIANIIYLVYPAGVMWYNIHPLSYRVVQTMLFHSIMTIYGILMIVFEYKKMEIKKCYRDLAVIACLTVWALIGNYIYSGTSGNYSHMFNWFFVINDPLGVIPTEISPYVMPFLNIVVFFAVEIIIHLVVLAVKKAINSKKRLDNPSPAVIQ